MDRQTVYAGSIPLETDLLNTNKNVMTAIAQLSADLFGTKTVFSGLNCIANTPAAMNVVITPGSVYSLAVRDATPYSSLAADATQILKQGIILTNTVLACPAPVTSGQSINYLVSASFLEVDINPVVLPYYNSTNPSQAFSGPGGLGTSQNTTRQDTVQITLTAGIAATTGSQTTPATPAGQTALWIVTVPYGAASITAANIAAAVQTQPLIPVGGFLANIGERFSSIVPVSTTGTLTNAVLGALVNVTATGTTQTLPLASSCPNGTSVCLAYMQASGSVTVARNGTDTLAFGQGSSANSITLSPGEEVQFVSNGVNGWVSAGQTLSTGVTPAQFDNSTKLMTSAGVRTVGIQASGVNIVTTTGNITLAMVGGTIIGNSAAGITETLPAASTVPAGGRLEFLNVNAGVMTVARNGSTDTISVNGSTVTSLALGGGDTLTLESNGASGWYAVSGSAQLGSAAVFSASKAASGYQKLPSGLIVQWGQVTAVSAGTAATFPITFPNGVFTVTVGSNSAASAYVWTNWPITTAGFTAYSSSATAASTWVAFGY
ncbi:gp53-like domain-containing protein [Cupriavidus basilensis]|uniref:gp53-like domain-containing protein n=1 Tax=Cupriavidus basilensis TaxID=68895 RepID=UPI0039F6575F